MKYNVKRHAVVQPLGGESKLIALTRGQNAIVDSLHFEWLNQWHWQAQPAPNGYGFYAVRIHQGKKFYMHRAIRPTGRSTDHWNRNGLDNRWSNLRPCSQSSNAANSKKRCDNTTGYRGVHSNRAGTWAASIKVLYRKIHLGTFPDKESAARAYDVAAMQHFGKFAHCNFPINA